LVWFWLVCLFLFPFLASDAAVPRRVRWLSSTTTPGTSARPTSPTLACHSPYETY
jgi:hypothetical protein